MSADPLNGHWPQQMKMHNIHPSWDKKNAPKVFLICLLQMLPQVKGEKADSGKTWGNTHGSPGTCPPLVSSEHVGAAGADAPGAIILILERVLSEATIRGPLRAWWHGTVLVGFRDMIWVTLALINHMVAVVDTDHLPGRPTLPTRCGALHWRFRRREGGSRACVFSVSGPTLSQSVSPKTLAAPSCLIPFLSTPWLVHGETLLAWYSKYIPNQPLLTIIFWIQAITFLCQDYCNNGLSAGILLGILMHFHSLTPPPVSCPHVTNCEPGKQKSDHVIHLVTSQFPLNNVQSPYPDPEGPSWCGRWELFDTFHHSPHTALQPHWPYGCSLSRPRTSPTQGFHSTCSTFYVQHGYLHGSLLHSIQALPNAMWSLFWPSCIKAHLFFLTAITLLDLCFSNYQYLVYYIFLSFFFFLPFL